MIRAALHLVDEEGAGALTLRSVAGRMNSSTATLYRHFTDRDDLVRQVVDAVFAAITLDEDLLATATWDQCVLHIAERLFAGMVRHRNVAPLMLEQVPAGPHALRLRERCLAVLLANGFDPERAVQTYATLARFVLGFGIQLRSESDRTSSDPERSGFATVDPVELPATARVESVGRIPLAEEFEYGLLLMITGLRAYQEQRGTASG